MQWFRLLQVSARSVSAHSPDKFHLYLACWFAIYSMYYMLMVLMLVCNLYTMQSVYHARLEGYRGSLKIAHQYEQLCAMLAAWLSLACHACLSSERTPNHFPKLWHSLIQTCCCTGPGVQLLSINKQAGRQYTFLQKPQQVPKNL